jgi:hypothetical protein
VFTGRAVAALLNKATNEDLARMSGKVVQTAELAVDYGFTDMNGGMPEGDFSGVEAAKRCREVMSKPVLSSTTWMQNCRTHPRRTTQISLDCLQAPKTTARDD